MLFAGVRSSGQSQKQKAKCILITEEVKKKGAVNYSSETWIYPLRDSMVLLTDGALYWS